MIVMVFVRDRIHQSSHKHEVAGFVGLGHLDCSVGIVASIKTLSIDAA